MNFIGRLQKSIEFMENNMNTPMTNEDVAKAVFMSGYHFHRIFSMITGMSVKVYLLSRRMSLAGEEVILTDKKIIDISLDYCYSTPESFTKAFIRFHGISPSGARRAGGGLKMFNRLQIKLTTEGGKAMDYRIEKRAAFTVLTKSRLFSGDIISEDDNTEIPDFWKEASGDGTLKVLSEHSKEKSVYGLCSPVDKASNSFKYGIGKEVDGGTRSTEGFEIWEVNHPLWAVFRCIGETPDCIGDTWTRIFNEFLPGSDYEFAEYIDFEYYPVQGEEGLFCEIWIPIGKK